MTAMNTAVERLLERHGLTATHIQPDGGTAGRTWRVQTDRGVMFVRQRGVRTATPQRIAFDHGLRLHLAEHGLPVFPPMADDQGQRVCMIDGGAYELYPFVKGLGYSTDLAERVREPAGRLLARFHAAASDYTGSCESTVPAFSNLPMPIEESSRFDDPRVFLDVIDYVLSTELDGQQRRDVLAARKRVAWLAKAYSADAHRSLPRGVIHADYICFNMLYDDAGEVVALLDFDWAWRDVRIRDVAEGMFFFGARREGELDGSSIWSLTRCPRFDEADMRAFLSAYEAITPLTVAERRHLGLAMLAIWVLYRTEGMMKVPLEDRPRYLLSEFHRPFEWFDKVGIDVFDR